MQRILATLILTLSFFLPLPALADALSDTAELVDFTQSKMELVGGLLQSPGYGPTTATHMENLVLRPLRTASDRWASSAMSGETASYREFGICHEAVKLTIAAIEQIADQLRRMDNSPYPDQPELITASNSCTALLNR